MYFYTVNAKNTLYKCTNHVLTPTWQYVLGEVKDTFTGKKSSGLAGMENSIVPVLLLESMTGRHHSSTCLRES